MLFVRRLHGRVEKKLEFSIEKNVSVRYNITYTMFVSFFRWQNS